MKALKRKRAWNKALSTLEINQIKELIAGYSSRTKMTYLKEKLNEAIAGTIEVHEEMMKLLDESKQSKDGRRIEDIVHLTSKTN